MNKINKYLYIGLIIWILPILGGIIISLISKIRLENFGMLFTALTAFHPDPIGAEESNKLFFYSWAFVVAFLFAILAWIGIKKQSIKAARIFLVITIISFIVGFLRLLINLHIA